MEGLTLKEVLDLGLQGASLLAVWALWMRLNGIIDRLFTYLEAAKVERHAVYSTMTARKLEDDVKAAGTER